ncbi:MAG TPA: glycosyltransferase family 39 protein [Terriglobia bacterium]|nr:glycosyltransferase family 39 protein [Terriglobia bacterium]
MIPDRVSAAVRPSKSGSGGWLALALVFVLVQALPSLSYPIGRDQATYSVIGRGLVHGASLYRDLWDNKPPGIFYIYAFIVKIFGTVLWSIGLLDILWLLAISFCIFRFTERSLGKAAAFLAVQVNVAMHIRAGYWDAGQPETFLMLFVFASYLMIAEQDGAHRLKAAYAGALFGAAFWIKYNAIAFAPFLLLTPYFQITEPRSSEQAPSPVFVWRKETIRVVWFGAGFLMISAILVSGLLFSGAWSGFLEEQFQVLPRYAATAFAVAPHYWMWVAGRIKTWLGIWTLCAAPAAFVIAWKRRQLSRLAPVLTGAAGGFAALTVQLRYQPYYFETCYPFFAIFWAYLALLLFDAALLLARKFTARRWQAARVLTWVAFANLIAICLPGPVLRIVVNYKAFNEWRRDPAHFYSNYAWPGAAEDFRDVLRVINYLKRVPDAAAGVFVWGNEPLIYYLSDYRPPARFIWDLPLISPWGLPDWRKELVQRLSQTRPRFIIVARGDEIHDLSGTVQDSQHALQSFPALAQYIRGSYRPCADEVTFVIYCRSRNKPDGSSARPPS